MISTPTPPSQKNRVNTLSIGSMQIMIGLAHYPQANTISMADEVADMVEDIEVDKVAELVLDQTFENQEARLPPIFLDFSPNSWLITRNLDLL